MIFRKRVFNVEMIVHLDSDIFDVVDNGIKCVEGRLNDEKRQKLNIGDKLIFLRRPDDIDSIEAVVEDLVYYDNFKDMVNDYTIEELYLGGYPKDDYLNLLKRFYSDEEQEKYGVVAIRFRKMM